VSGRNASANTIVVRYRCAPDRADENAQLVEAVFAELAASNPGSIRYATFRLDDDTFIHIAEVEGDNPLARTEAFARFQQALGERCIQGPEPHSARLVGSYRFDLTD
jgi:hypothetical protein